MAKFRCTPSSQAYPAPASSGSAVAGPSLYDWSVSDESSVDGDILKIDISVLPTPQPGYEVSAFDVALCDRAGAATVRRLLGGPAVNWPRYLKVDTAQNVQKVKIRSVQRIPNQIKWNGSASGYTPQVGDAVVQSATGATATVAYTEGADGPDDWVVLSNISGSFQKDKGGSVTTIAGNNGEQEGPIHVTHFDAYVDEIKSEWSAPKYLTPTSGSPTVTITASKTTCLQGEAIFFEAAANGFECERPMHDLHYRFYVDKPGEAGTYAALPAFFDDAFGAGSNNRAEGYSSIWAFAPRTTGSVTVKCDVRDKSGNVATGTVTLTVADPVSDFSASNIYVASSTSKAVPGDPGIPGGNFYADIETLIAALPTGETDEALILLDTADTHGASQYAQYDLAGPCPQRMVVMPYDASGVGANASQRAVSQSAFKITSQTAVVYRVDVAGPFDATDPFSLTSYPPKGMETAGSGHFSLSESKVSGWGNEGLTLPTVGNVGAYADVEVTDIHAYTIHQGDTGKHALAGVYAYHNPGAWRYQGELARGGGEATDSPTFGYFTDLGSYRTSRPAAPRGMSKCVFFTSCGWGGTGLSQPAIRFFGNGGWGDEHPHPFHGTECITECADALALAVTSASSGNSYAEPQDMVLDKWVHLTAIQPKSGVSVGFGGVTLRNWHLAVGDVTPYSGVDTTGTQFYISASNISGNAENPGQKDNQNNPVVVEHCTFADLRRDPIAGQTQSTGELRAVRNSTDAPMSLVERNNLMVATQFTNPGESVDNNPGNYDTAPRWTPLYAGRFDWDPNVNDPNPPTVEAQTPDLSDATPPGVTATFAPNAGSPFYQTATGDVWYDDIQSRVRPTGTASQGAYDPGGV